MPSRFLRVDRATAMLLHSYSHGIFSSRQIEQSTYEHLGGRYIGANYHPDHDTICKFRRENGAMSFMSDYAPKKTEVCVVVVVRPSSRPLERSKNQWASDAFIHEASPRWNWNGNSLG